MIVFDCALLVIRMGQTYGALLSWWVWYWRDNTTQRRQTMGKGAWGIGAGHGDAMVWRWPDDGILMSACYILYIDAL